MRPPFGLSQLLALFLFLATGLESSKIERFEDKKASHAKNFQPLEHPELQHVSQEEALKSLPQQVRLRLL